MDKVVLEATKRTVTGRKVNGLRREGYLPAVMYGTNFDSTPVLLNLHETTLKLRHVSSSTIVYINLEGKQYATLIQDKQRNFIQGSLSHLDFRVIDMNVVIKAMVPLTFVGEAPVIRTFGGYLMTELNEVEVEALPGDLPETIEVDVTSLTDYDVHISVADLKVSDKVSILSDPELIIALVSPMAEEEEVTGEAAAAEPEIIERGKKEEEE